MPEDHLAPLIGGIQPIEEGRASPADVEVACGRRRKAYPHLCS